MKTVDDVTREEWIELTEASIDLLSCCRFLYWLNGSKGADESDTSVVDTMSKMAFALERVGLNVDTQEAFEKNLEEMLASDMPPEQWNKLKNAEAEREQ